MLDHTAVGGRDDHHREGGGAREEDGQVRVLTEVLRCFLRAVRRRRQSIRAQSYLGKKCSERDVAEEVRVLQVLGSAQQQILQTVSDALASGRRRHRWLLLPGMNGMHPARF
jgi:hypothetical protein